MTAMLLFTLTGCAVPAITVWSPDGTKAAYATQGQGQVFDVDGKTVTKIEGATGAFAWSADSSTLYHSTAGPADVNPFYEVNYHWLPEPDERPADPDLTSDRSVIGRTKDGKTDALFDLPGKVLMLRLSPDGLWLAAVAPAEDQSSRVYVYSVASSKLYLLDDRAGFAVAFSGAGKLVYVMADARKGGIEESTGRLVEVALAPEVDASPQRVPLVNVLTVQTPWIEPAGPVLLFTSYGRSFPSPAVEGEGPTFKLYSFNRADKRLVAIAEEVGPFFAVSPDGTRVLLDRRKDGPDRGELVVMNVNGSDAHALRVTEPLNRLPAFPAWRTNEEVSWSSPDPVANAKGPDDKTTLFYDLVLYKLAGGKSLAPVKTLSTGWANDTRPIVTLDAGEALPKPLPPAPAVAPVPAPAPAAATVPSKTP